MASLQNKCILIIDDMRDVRALVKTILETDGAEVYEAESVDQGLQVAAQRAPQLVITDLMIPGKTGFDFLREMKKHDFLSRVPVIVLSGLNDRGSVLEAIELGARDYVIKPIKATFLLQKVRKSLNSSEFVSYQFIPEARPVAVAFLRAEIASASEVGVTIESQVKFAPNASLKLSGDFIDKIGCTETITRTSNAASIYRSKERYLTNVNFVGLSTEIAKAIREKLGEWK